MTAPSARIAEALPEDLPALLDLQKRAFRSEAVFYGDFAMPPMVQTLEELRAESRVRLILKLEVEGRILASVRAHLDSDGVCRIGRLITDPGHQGHGHGTALMRAIEARFPAARRYELFTGWKSEGNLRFYRRLGYAPVRDVPAGPGYCMTVLVKPNPEAASSVP